MEKIYQYRTLLDDRLHPVLKESGSYVVTSKVADSPESITRILNEAFDLGSLAEEHLMMIAFSTNMEILGVFEVSHGIVDASFANPREIFTRLLLSGAANFMLAHNHPSGEVRPSSQDMDIYKKVMQLSDLMSIPLMDNLILGRNGNYFSFREAGY